MMPKSYRPDQYNRFLQARERLDVPCPIQLRVITPKGKGTLWQVWETRIGVVLDEGPGRVTFFYNQDDLDAIQPIDEVLTELPDYLKKSGGYEGC